MKKMMIFIAIVIAIVTAVALTGYDGAFPPPKLSEKDVEKLLFEKYDEEFKVIEKVIMDDEKLSSGVSRETQYKAHPVSDPKFIFNVLDQVIGVSSLLSWLPAGNPYLSKYTNSFRDDYATIKEDIKIEEWLNTEGYQYDKRYFNAGVTRYYEIELSNVEKLNNFLLEFTPLVNEILMTGDGLREDDIYIYIDVFTENEEGKYIAYYAIDFWLHNYEDVEGAITVEVLKKMSGG